MGKVCKHCGRVMFITDIEGRIDSSTRERYLVKVWYCQKCITSTEEEIIYNESK